MIRSVFPRPSLRRLRGTPGDPAEQTGTKTAALIIGPNRFEFAKIVSI